MSICKAEIKTFGSCVLKIAIHQKKLNAKIKMG